MRQWLAICFLLIAISIPLLSADDAKSIVTKMNKSWLDAYAAADFDRLGSVYDGDAVVMAEGHEPVEGREAIKKFFADDFRYVPKRSITLKSLRIEGSSDLLIDSGEYRFDGVDVDSKPVHIIGNYITVFKKTVGEWHTALEVWNVRTPGQLR